jgi:hypothetical protein
MNPLMMTQSELNAMAVLATQFSDQWRPHLREVVLGVELAVMIEPNGTAGALDKEASEFTQDIIQMHIRAPPQLTGGLGDFE